MLDNLHLIHHLLVQLFYSAIVYFLLLIFVSSIQQDESYYCHFPHLMLHSLRPLSRILRDYLRRWI